MTDTETQADPTPDADDHAGPDALTPDEQDAVDESPTVIDIDFDDLTFGEMEMIEDVIGIFPDKVARLETDFPKSKFLTAFAWVAMRRTDPDITVEEVRARKMNTIQFTDPAGGATPLDVSGSAS